jgi:hypothetical protein
MRLSSNLLTKRSTVLEKDLMKLYKPFVSFALLSECVPAISQEYWHCDMKRGFKRVRQREPEIAAFLAQDTTVQRIGLLAQRAVQSTRFITILLH